MIATKFPSYVVRHPNKVVWLVHQFRQAYELDGTELGQFSDAPRMDRVAPCGAPARPRDARGGTGALRDLLERRRAAERSTGLAAQVLLPPPQQPPYRSEAYEPFVLS